MKRQWGLGSRHRQRCMEGWEAEVGLVGSWAALCLLLTVGGKKNRHQDRPLTLSTLTSSSIHKKIKYRDLQ